jgi:hypothetical protein
MSPRPRSPPAPCPPLPTQLRPPPLRMRSRKIHPKGVQKTKTMMTMMMNPSKSAPNTIPLRHRRLLRSNWHAHISSAPLKHTLIGEPVPVRAGTRSTDLSKDSEISSVFRAVPSNPFQGTRIQAAPSASLLSTLR